MSTPTRSDALRDLIADVLAVDPARLGDDSGPPTVAEWTSLKHLELVVTLEEEFGVALSHREIVGMRSVGAVRAMLAGKGVTT